MSERGKFIVVEGLEGAGKSTAIKQVTAALKQHHILDVTTTREPGGTPLAEQLRTLVKGHHEETITAEAELLLMYASRVQLIHNVIQPALARGAWVIGDRHDLSTRAYQGGGRQIPDSRIDAIRAAVLNGFEPDFTLYMDIDPELGLQRARGRGELDRIELQSLDFFQRTREKYLAIAGQDPTIRIIDASDSIDGVAQQIQVAMAEFFAHG